MTINWLAFSSVNHMRYMSIFSIAIMEYFSYLMDIIGTCTLCSQIIIEYSIILRNFQFLFWNIKLGHVLYHKPMAAPRGSWIIGDGWRGFHFLSYTTNFGRDYVLNQILGQLGRWTNGKAISWGNTSSIAHKFGTCSNLVRMLSLCGQWVEGLHRAGFHLQAMLSTHKWLCQTQVMRLHLG